MAPRDPPIKSKEEGQGEIRQSTPTANPGKQARGHYYTTAKTTLLRQKSRHQRRNKGRTDREKGSTRAADGNAAQEGYSRG